MSRLGARAGVRRSRTLVLLVGRDTDERTELARRIIEEGKATIVCGGPDLDCPLLEGERCLLVDAADVGVFMSVTDDRPRVVAALSMCARAVPKALVGAEDPDAVVRALDP